MIPLDKALKIVLNQVKSVKKEKTGLLLSVGRVLAEDIYAEGNIPSFDRSAMDGYAVRAGDTKGTSYEHPVTLKVIENLPAGYTTDKAIKRGEVIKIMTGALMPEGSDSVVMVEYTKIASQYSESVECVEIFREVKPAENVGKTGEDVKKGELILKKGTFIRSPEIGMLASLGKAKVRVFKKPKVSIIPTGDEVVDIEKKLNKGKIRDSNSFSIYSQVLACGGEPIRLGIARDNKRDILRKIKRAIAIDSDIIILSGGVSVGDYDIVKDVLIDSGVKPLFWKVAMKPGKPTFFGLSGKSLVFGLPGYPVSSMVVFELMVRPALMAMLNRKGYERKKVLAVLDKEISQKKGRRNFMRGIALLKNGVYHVAPTGTQKSAVLKSMVLANSLIEVPEDIKKIKAGGRVWIRLLEG